ncbi:hypothetical protein JTB14_000014 [Gonioctena quinquepunctata]|nr:hypothetical protein JTB14_000014 [Gonioctena quinquepunctata]
MDDISRAKSYLNVITLHLTKIKEIEVQILWINKEEVSLSFPQSTYPEYEDLKNHIYPFYHLLKLCLEVQRNLSVWQDGPFEMLDYNSTNSAVEKFHKELTDIYKTYRKKLRQAQDDNVTLRFKGTVDDPDILNWPAPLKLCGKALKQIEEFKPSVKVMKIICNATLSKRHWTTMSEIAGKNVTPNAGTTLRKIMEIDFHSQLLEYEIISTGATKEKQLRDDLEQLKSQWSDINFTLTTRKDTDNKILTDLEAIEAVVNDHTIRVLNMRGSVFVKPHDNEVRRFYSRISKVKRTIENWTMMQKHLLKLSPLFSGVDLSDALPEETALFSKIVNIYKTFISLISEDPVVMRVVETTDITREVLQCLTEFEIIDEGVIKYLDILRQRFPRLYFLANDEISRVISSKKQAIESAHFLNGMFPGIKQLDITDRIVGVFNSEAECLTFENTIGEYKDFTLEKLCSEIEEQMKASLKKQFLSCYKSFKRVELKELLPLYCTQILELVSQIHWTEKIETALSLAYNIKLRMYYQKLGNSMKNKINMMRDSTANLERMKLKSLIINDINNRSLMETILDSNRANKNDFVWQAYFKYYYADESCYMHAMNYKILYFYEYQESACHIISAPLTDRCSRTLLNAFFLNYCGLIETLDGSCSSETVKSLVRSFGGLLIFFSCSRYSNCSILRQLLLGSLLCGSWLCLENLQLVRNGVMSVISQDLSSVQAAKQQNIKHCRIGNKLINFLPTNFVCACFEVKNYSSSLPLNVKVLFRPVKMLRPDLEKVSEISLYSFGFQTASLLSKKLCCVFNMLRDLMDMETHYNYDIHKLKRILLECGGMITEDASEDESSIMVSSIRRVLAPQIGGDDEKIFNNILTDVFSNVSRISHDDGNVREFLLKQCEEDNVQADDEFIRRVLEAYECLDRISSVIFVGDTYTGKTTVIKLCQKIFEKKNEETTICHFINPNCLDYRSLYGYSDPSNQKWEDGIVTKLIRNSVDHGTERKWLIFDGTIESFWVENIKTSLDENKKFYTDSGERVELSNDTAILFEVKDLDTCSPSIVSRSSVIYFPQYTISWNTMVRSWINTCTSEWIEEYRTQIHDLFCWLIPPCIEFIEKSCTQLCDPNQLNLVKNMISLTELILDDVFDRKDEEMKNLPIWIQATIIQAGASGLGAILDTSSKQKFDEFYKSLWKGQIADHPHPKSLEKLEVSIPQEGLIYDYQYMYKQRGNWKLVQDILKTEKIRESPYLHEFLVPTGDTLKCNNIIDMFLKNNQHLLFIGPSGTGKSAIIEDALIHRVNGRKFESSHINFNLNLDSRMVQQFVLSKMNRRKIGLFTPPLGKKFLLFIDNLNLISPNVSSGLNSIELLRQHLDHKVWYDFSQGNEIQVDDLTLISAMGVVEGSRKKLCRRFLRHFNVFAINESPGDSLTKIYSQSLLHNWRKLGFPSDIATTVNHIVQATINVYKQVKMYCRATLSRCHYIFNQNSLSKVIQGCSMLKKEVYDGNKKVYLKLWAHEIMRVFGDRLSSLDNTWLQTKIKECVENDFNESFEDNFENNGCLLNKLVFSTINDRENSNKRYEEICNQEVLVEKVNEALRKYNENESHKLQIILFQYALEKVFKISRVLSFSPGNALLIGPCGSGRRNLTKLVCFLHKQKLFEPVITQGYSLEDWNNEIKTVLKEAGALEHQCVFLVTEEQLIDETFLQNVDYLLQNGEIPNLYDMDEKQEILELTRLSAQGGNKNLEIASSSVFHYFNKKTKENLHLIICLSSTDNTLRNRMRNFPHLMNCHVIWWDYWPDESLQDIAMVWTSNLNLQSEVREKVIQTLIYFHRDSQSNARQVNDESKQNNYVTPVSYIHLLKLFMELMTKKQNEMTAKKNLYLQGLAKLSYAANQISDMQKALAEYQPQLAGMTQKAIEMTEQIALETIEVEKASALVRKDEEVASEQAIVAQILKSECESELAQAIPILEDAISALNTLKPSDITLVKSMKNPPDAIKLVMAAVCVIKDVKPDRIPDPSTGRKTIDYWGPSKRILGDMNFLQTLKDFDKDHIKPEIMVKIRKEYLPHKDFKPHVVAKASSAAEGLCKWIIAMDMYDKVAKEVAPKKEKLEKAEREYAETMAVLNQKKEEVKRIEDKLASLKALLDDATKKQLKLQQEVDACNKKLGSAQNLIGSLGGEKIRWTEAVRSLETHESLLLGNVLISSAMIAYLGPFGVHLRTSVVQRWHLQLSYSVACSEDFSITTAISSEAETESWVQNDLPNDEFFFQNGIIQNCSKLYSVFIDPEYIADNWIKKTERRNDLTVTKFTHVDYLEKLKSCMMLGKPIVIHKIKQTLPASLNQLISNQLRFKNDGTCVTMDKENLKIEEGFKLYMVSNLDKPQFPAELCKNINLINFSITSNGLSQCLLKIVTEIEKPDIRKKRKELYSKKSRNRIELKEHESNILRTLCESETDILEDEASIKILDQSKELARIVREKQEDSKGIELIMEEFRSKYIDVATFAADLYSCVADLKQLNYIYQFSLDWYVNLFYKSIALAEKSRELAKRCNNLKKTFIYHLFLKTVHSLHEDDKIIFLFQLTLAVKKSTKSVTPEEISFLLANDRQTVAQETRDLSRKLRRLENLPVFQALLSSFNPELWETFLESPSPENIPPPWDIELSSFQQLILVKVLKPEHLYHYIQTFIGKELGENFTKTHFYDIIDTYNESYSLSSILYILTPQFDPLQSVSCLAEKKKVLHSFKTLSFGEDEAAEANTLINDAQVKGSWVLLQNCHLLPDWFEILERRLTEMDFDNTHENFRLWLTSEATEDIPIELLQSSIKVVVDSPAGFKQNLLGIFKNSPLCEPEFFYGCPSNQRFFTRLLYGLASFHCVVQQRCEFNTVGWNAPYAFDYSDLQISLQQLRVIINEDISTRVNLEKSTYFIEECHYGGQLNNIWDISLTGILLQQFMNAELDGTKNYLFNDLGEYGLPKKCDYEDYIGFMDGLPEKHNPEMFGMNKYIDAFAYGMKAEKLLRTIEDAANTHVEKGIDANEFSLITSIEDTLRNLPQKLDHNPEQTHIISREIERYNVLLEVMSESLQHLKRAIGGAKLISPDEEEMAKDILSYKVPKIWTKNAFISHTNLSSFVQGLQKGIDFFQTVKPTVKTFPLPIFSFPRAVISKAKLDFCAKYGISPENADFEFTVVDNRSESTEDDIVISGLFLLGARWDEVGHKLGETMASVHNAFPPILFRSTNKSKERDERYLYRCPLYRTDVSEDFIITIPLKTEESSEHWSRRGVKLVCQIEQ